MSVFTDNAKALHKHIPGVLKRLRAEKRLTMRNLSEAIGSPHSLVGKTEQTQRRMDIAEFVIYCEGLGVDPVKALKQILSAMGK